MIVEQCVGGWAGELISSVGEWRNGGWVGGWVGYLIDGGLMNILGRLKGGWMGRWVCVLGLYYEF